MTLANDLKTLRPGDTLVCRDGTRRTCIGFDRQTGRIIAYGGHPFYWYQDSGASAYLGTIPGDVSDWDIVRVIRAKKPKARAISDADFQSASKSVRKQYAGTIKALATTKAKRLEEMKGTK